ncbi:MAG: alpha/beta hydrolase [Crocinitomicaceae bacterium]
MKNSPSKRFHQLVVVGLMLFFSASCNLVRLNEHHAAKKLNKLEVFNAQFKADSMEINYWKGGKGPVLVFVHGFGGNALMNWRQQLEHYAKTNTVIACDLLWFGKSHSNAQPNLSAQVNALNQVLTYLKVDSAAIIGQSYGGFVALDFTYQFPEKVTRLVMANSPGSTFDVAILDTLCAKYHVAQMADLFVLEEPKNVQRLTNLSTYSDHHIPNFLLKQMYQQYFVHFHEEQRLLMQTLAGEQNRLSNLSIIQKIPTLVLWGDKDEIFPKREGEKLAEAVHGQFVSIPNCGHAPQVDNPKMFLTALDAFLLPKP